MLTKVQRTPFGTDHSTQDLTYLCLLKEWFVSLSFQSIVSMYCGLASMEETDDHCNISVDELDCKLALVFLCKHGEEREKVRERERNFLRLPTRTRLLEYRWWSHSTQFYQLLKRSPSATFRPYILRNGYLMHFRFHH